MWFSLSHFGESLNESAVFLAFLSGISQFFALIADKPSKILTASGDLNTSIFKKESGGIEKFRLDDKVGFASVRVETVSRSFFREGVPPAMEGLKSAGTSSVVGVEDTLSVGLHVDQGNGGDAIQAHGRSISLCSPFLRKKHLVTGKHHGRLSISVREEVGQLGTQNLDVSQSSGTIQFIERVLGIDKEDALTFGALKYGVHGMNSGFDAAGVPSTVLKRAHGATVFILPYAHDSRSDDPSENVSYADRPDAWVLSSAIAREARRGAKALGSMLDRIMD